MSDLDREQIKRECADALEGLLQEQRVDGLAGLADAIRTLGPTYQAHGEQIQAAAWAREDNTIVWNLIHTLDKLERGVA